MKPRVTYLTIACLFTTATTLADIESNIDSGLRIRSANTEYDGNSGDAITVKGRFNAGLRFNEQFSTFLQLDYVESFLKDKHSTALLHNDNPFMFDTPGSDLNQLFAKYAWDDGSVKLGRQVITFGSERFIGDIDFWQNDQTFDGVLIEQGLFTSSTLQYAYVHNVNRIFGNRADQKLSSADIRIEALAGVRPIIERGDHAIDGNFLHFEYNEFDYVKLAAYGYAVHNYNLPDFSNRVVGASSEFNYKPGAIKYTGTLEFAWQQKQESTTRQWIPYRLVEGGIGIGKVDFSLRWEALEDRDGEFFDTPLGSRHEFQGWADAFSTSPAGGLDDFSVRTNVTWRPWRLDLRYHWFRSASVEDLEFGQEFDMDLIFRPARKHEFKLRFADFIPDSEQTFRPLRSTSLYFSYSFNI